MKKAKNDLWLEREKVLKEETRKNMGRAPEKKNCIVEKRMGPKNKERLDILTGKKKEIKKEKKRNHWKDEDLMEKIDLINNWKNTNWFEPNRTYNPDMKKREILKPLVLSNKKKIKKQDKLKEEKINENKRKIKHDLMEQRHQQIKNKNINPIKFSKYPINQNIFEMTKNNVLTERDKEDSDYVTVNFKDPYKTHNFQFGNYKIEIDDKKLFLDAYKQVLLKDEKNSKKYKNSRNQK